MRYGEYVSKAKALRHTAVVEAWISAFKKRSQYPDCKHCSYPHSSNLLCGRAPFGEVRFGGHYYSVDLSNVVYWHEFIQTCAPENAFHWRDEKFFRRTSNGVEITFFTSWNNTPQRVVWKIPANEWESIVTATSCDTDKKNET